MVLLPISQDTALFLLFGTSFGGNGLTTLGLPDRRGRTPVGVGSGPCLMPAALGQQFGSWSVGLTQANLPSPAHTVVRAILPMLPAGIWLMAGALSGLCLLRTRRASAA